MKATKADKDLRRLLARGSGAVSILSVKVFDLFDDLIALLVTAAALSFIDSCGDRGRLAQLARQKRL